MTAPRSRTVDEVAAPYANHLTPVPTRDDGVCPTCRTGCNGWPRCYNCGQSVRLLPSSGADAVGIVALAPSRAQLAYELVNYKRPATAAAVRSRFAVGLACVLWKWLSDHGDCLARAAGLTGFEDIDAITTVPSSNRSGTGNIRWSRLSAASLSERTIDIDRSWPRAESPSANANTAMIASLWRRMSAA